MIREGLNACGERVAVGGQDIQYEMVGGVIRQLVLPSVEQFAAQQTDQRHGEQYQPESQRLTSCRQWVTE